MTSQSLEDAPAEFDAGASPLRHGHCGVCFPLEEFPAGSTVISWCGIEKTVQGIIWRGEDVPNACVVCMDMPTVMQHMRARHPEKLV